MAFPTVVGTATWDAAAQVTTHRAQMPNVVINAGDLIVVVLGVADIGGITLDGQWTLLDGAGVQDTRSYVVYQIAAGDEQNDLLTVGTTAGTRSSVSHTYVFRNWGALPVVELANGNTSEPNPPSNTSGFGVVDVTWIAAAVYDGTDTLVAAPANYANALGETLQGGVGIVSARRNLAAATEDPAAFDMSANSLWQGITIAVRGPTVKNGSDSGTGTDARSSTYPRATHTRTDTGGGTDISLTVGQIVLASDTGAGTDASALFATLARADTGAGVDVVNNRQIVLADSGVGTDAANVEVLTVVIETRPLPATLEEVLRGSHQPIARLLFLGGDLETVLHTIDAVMEGDNQWLLSGDVVDDRRRNVPKSADVRIVNKFGLYDPVNADSLVWPNRIIRLERGARIGGVPQYRQLITGLLDDWSVAEDTGMVSFSVWSRMHQADQQFPEAVTYAAGMLVDDVIRAMAERAGMGTTDAFYDLDSGGLTLPDARTYDSDDNILNSMVKLAFDNGLDLYDDGAGVLVLRPFVDPNTTTEAWHFRRGVDAVMTELARTGKATTVYNRAVAVGIGADLYPMRAEARVTNPNDPLYNPEDGSGPLGDRPRPTYTTSDVTGQQALNDLAYRLLVEGALFEESLAGAAVPIPILGARNVVRVTGAGTDAKYLLDTVHIPVGPGTMRMTTRRVRSLVAE